MSTLLASLMSSSVLRLMKTGLPLHFTVTVGPGSMLERSTSREASASTSLLADILRTNFKMSKRSKEA
uniref:Isp1 n=1 Tax=Arundo donax TaxID=35708 RepID=A0A0A9GHA4_ARUDO